MKQFPKINDLCVRLQHLKKVTLFNTHTDPPEGLCPVAPSARQECGNYGITKEECLNKSCCWDPTVEGAKWCFKQPGK